MRLLIMGAPGAGKGTQAARIADRYHIPAISTGEIFRSNVAEGTPLGQEVGELMAKGKFVPDELTEEIVFDRLDHEDAADGFLLDGFPRTMHQVEALDEYLEEHDVQLDAVISLDVDGEVIVKRLLKRAELEGRVDDNEETIRHRMELYNDQTAPLLDHYDKAGILKKFDGQGEVSEVFQRIVEEIDELQER